MDSLKQYSPSQIIKFIHEKKEAFWLKERERRALALFHEAARRVPAYKDFLKRNRVLPDRIKIWQDFSLVPTTSKKEYLQQYPLEDLCWDGTLAKPLVFCASSGSTGEPFYFPRQERLEEDSSILYELFFKNSSLNQGPILVINGFGMGVWIGGLIAYKSLEMARLRGNYPISIITPGVNIPEALKALKNLAHQFSRTVLIGYPPFVKDIIDLAICEGVDFSGLNIRIITAAEAFTETFRDYLAERACLKNPCLDTMNIYGSADIGTMAVETPISILTRRAAMKDKRLFAGIFSAADKTPTLAQYNPFAIAFEAPDREIVLTGDSAIPLVRYSIGDNGGVLTFSEINSRFKEHGIDLLKEAADNGIEGNIYELPFVFVHERSDFSTTIYGLQIYPEFVRDALIDKKLAAHLTGKFTMVTRYDAGQDQYLEINLELMKGKEASAGLERDALDTIHTVLRQKSSEFKELTNHVKERELVKVVFWPAGHPGYFKAGGKQKWVQNQAN